MGAESVQLLGALLCAVEDQKRRNDAIMCHEIYVRHQQDNSWCRGSRLRHSWCVRPGPASPAHRAPLRKSRSPVVRREAGLLLSSLGSLRLL